MRRSSSAETMVESEEISDDCKVEEKVKKPLSRPRKTAVKDQGKKSRKMKVEFSRES